MRYAIVNSVIATILFLSTSAPGTPGKATWTRVIFLGANETHYCTEFIEREQPGSYYDYTDRTYLCKYALKDNALVEKHLLRVTVYRDTTTFGNWRHRDTLRTPLNVEKYLVENDIPYVFPSDQLEDCKLILNWRGLFLKIGWKTTRLVSSTDFEKIAPGMTMDSLGYGHPKVINYYKAFSHYFFLIQYGEANYDGSFEQAIIPVPKERLFPRKNK
jgi:hypothetical protein